jgi:hypothetical protein
MSLYNIVHGVNPFAGAWMMALQLKPISVGRFRDCYLQRSGDGLEIHVFTRNGGFNRSDYEAITAQLQAHKLYVRDFDEEFDSTYATYVFRVPEEILQYVAQIVQMNPEAVPDLPGKRFADFMQLMQTNPDDPQVQRVREAMRPTIEAIAGRAGGGDADPSVHFVTIGGKVRDDGLGVGGELSDGRVVYPTGRCFDDTLDYLDTLYFAGAPSEVVLAHFVVHAICIWPGDQPGTEHRAGEQFAHAWIEYGTHVIQSGIMDCSRCWYALDRSEFYQHLQVQQATRYTAREAIIENARTNHYGPWLPEYEALCKR